MKKQSNFHMFMAIPLGVLYGMLGGSTGALAGLEVKVTPVVVAEYHYNPIRKPDPFRSFLESEIAAEKRVAKLSAVPMSPLRRAPLDQYKLKGIAGDERRRSAIVEDASGKFYPIFRGTIIGQNNGKVVAIMPDRVIVEEAVKARGGQPKVNRFMMKLYKEPLEGKP